MTESDHKRAAIFLDRDGTLMVDVGYPRDPATVQLLPGVREGLTCLREAGFALAIISNQSGVGRGYFGTDDVWAVHERLVSSLLAASVTLDDVQYCFHAPWEGCRCRKPSPEMIRRSAARLGVALERSFMIGDKASDIEAGRRAGCRTIFLHAGSAAAPCPEADFQADRWEKVVQQVLALP